MAGAEKENIKTAVRAAWDSGQAILEVYQRDFTVEYKDDRSPLTEADKAAHEIICAGLEPTGMPVLSEESKTVSYEQRKNWGRFWLVDPLDGTKEFIKKNGEFTVNIALIDAGRPILGVVYAPVLRTIYYGSQAEGIEHGAWKSDNCTEKSVDEIFESAVRLPFKSAIGNRQSPIRVVASRSHMNPETEAFIAALEKQGRVELVSSGSSLKLCMVAEGLADVYPRIAPTMEWDTAAAQAVVEASGGRVVRYDPAISAATYLTQSAKRKEHSEDTAALYAPCPTLHALSYNKENLLNPFFVVSGRDCRTRKNA